MVYMIRDSSTENKATEETLSILERMFANEIEISDVHVS